jgi:hypothetical protein
MSALYLYAVLDAAPPDGSSACGPGVAGEPVRLRPAGGLQVAAGELPAPPEPCLQAMRAHDELVRLLAARTRSILPLRFGQLVDGAEALEVRMAQLAPGLRRALELVEDCDQSTLRVFGSRGGPDGTDAVADPSAAPPGARAGAGEAEAEGPGTRHLAALIRRRTAVPAELEPLLTTVAPLVRAQRIERAITGPLLASVYHLVRRSDRAAYDQALAQALPRRPELRVRASGPWPPYAFVSGWPA